MDEATRLQVELVLHRAQRWRRQWLHDHPDTDYEDDETFRLVRDLAEALERCTSGK